MARETTIKSITTTASMAVVSGAADINIDMTILQ